VNKRLSGPAGLKNGFGASSFDIHIRPVNGIVHNRSAILRIRSPFALAVRPFADGAPLWAVDAVDIVPPRWIAVVKPKYNARIVPDSGWVSARAWFLEVITSCPVLVGNCRAIEPGEAISWSFDAKSRVVSDSAQPSRMSIVVHRVQCVFHVLIRSQRQKFRITPFAKFNGLCKSEPFGVRVVLERPLFGVVPISDRTSFAHRVLKVHPILTAFNFYGRSGCDH
jgi:hypothetical protein